MRRQHAFEVCCANSFLLPLPVLRRAIITVFDGDGAVMAKLFLRDVAGARQYFEALTSKVGRSARDLRTRLLNAYLQAPEKLPERPRSTASVSWTCSDASTTHRRDG